MGKPNSKWSRKKKIAAAAALGVGIPAAVPLGFELAGHVLRIPGIYQLAHEEKGQYWFDKHEFDRFNERAQFNGDKEEEEEEGDVGFLPDPSIIGEWPLTEDNGIRVYTKDEKLLLKRKATRSWVKGDKIPNTIKKAAILREDSRRANGVSWPGVARALWTGIGGGSGFDVQIAKWLFTEKNREAKRDGSTVDKFVQKGLEMILAEVISHRYTPDERLLFYLNEAEYGPRVRGVQEGARQILGVELDEVDLPHALFLSVLPKNPSRDPRTKRGLEYHMGAYRNFVNSLRAKGLISEEAYEQALPEKYRKCVAKKKKESRCRRKSPIKIKGKKSDLVESGAYVSAVSTLIWELREEGLDIRPYIWYGNFGHRKHSSFGFRVNTTIDSKVSRALADGIRNKYGSSGRKGPEVSGVVVNQDGNVVAVLERKNSLWSDPNFFVGSRTSMASTLKPFEYVMFDESGVCGLDDIMVDTPRENDPQNWDHTSGRTMSVGEFLVKSNNVVTHQCYERFIREQGFDTFLVYLAKAGFDTAEYVVDEERCNEQHGGGIFDGLCLSVKHALGSRGASVLDVAGGYGVFLNDGEYIQPTIIDTIQVNGFVHPAPKRERVKVFSADAVAGVNDSLEVVGRKIVGRRLGDDFGAKTGTCEGGRCGWTAGNLWLGDDGQGYSFAVLVANEDNSPLGRKVWGSTTAGPIVRDFVAEISGKRAIARRKVKRVGEGSAGVALARAEVEEVNLDDILDKDKELAKFIDSASIGRLREVESKLIGMHFNYERTSAGYARTSYFRIRTSYNLYRRYKAAYGKTARNTQVYRDDVIKSYENLERTGVNGSAYRLLAGKYYDKVIQDIARDLRGTE